MFTYDRHPGNVHQHHHWVQPDTPRASGADGTTVLLIGRDGERAEFVGAIPGVLDQVEFAVERDPEAATVHVRVGAVYVPGNTSGLTLSGTAASLRQRAHGIFEQAIAGWPELGWTGHRTIFYD